MSEAKDPFDAIGADAGYQRPRLRSDLKIVYENQGSGTPRIRMVDPVSGKQFSFTEQEHRLCQTADGTADLRTIHAGFGAEMSPRDVTGFFRRLHVLGLLAPAAESAAPLPSPLPSPTTSSRGPRSQTRDATARRPGARTPGPSTPNPSTSRPSTPVAQMPGAKAPTPVTSSPITPSLTPVTTTPSGSGRLAARFPRPVKSDPRFRSGSESPSEVVAEGVAEAQPEGLAETPPETPPKGSAPQTIAMTGQEAMHLAAADLEATGVPARSGPVPPADPLDIIASNLAGSVAERRPGAFDEEDDPFSGMGGGLGGGMGGGLGGGRFGGGMGGGMGAGGPNRERIMAALAARKAGGGMGAGMGAGMGGGMMAGMTMAGAGVAPPVVEQRPASLTLFNPGLLLRLLYILFWPVKLILWIILPFVVMAGLTVFQNWRALAVDQAAFFVDYATLTLFLIGVFTVNLASRLAQGVAIVAHGGKVDTMGLMLVFGFVPRFFIDLSGVPGLDRRGQLWAHAAPMLARLGLFALGVLTWAITRETGTWLPQIALLIGQFGLVMFLFSAMPLVPGDGQRWIATYLSEPYLLPKAGAALRHLLTGRPLPPMIEQRDLWPLALFAAGTILTVTAVVLGLMVVAALLLEAELGGTGVSLFLGVVAAFSLWLVALRASIGRRAARLRGGMGAAPGVLDGKMGPDAKMGPDGKAGPDAKTGPMLGRMVDPSPNAALLAQAQMQAQMQAQTQAQTQAQMQAQPQPAAGAAKVVWGVIAMGLLAIAFLPYDYEAGGLVEILPSARGQAVARSDGEILEIMVAEGDLVTKGQILAQLSSWNQERQVSVTQSMLAGAEAELAGLLAGPKPEQIAVAQRQLESAQASVDFSTAEAERARTLVASGTVSQQAVEEANSVLDADLASLEVARARLELAQSGATPEQILVAQAEVERLELELAFLRDEVERTRIAAPMDGRVVTGNLHLRHGSFLRTGETLIEIEDAATVNAVIAVTEADIALIGIDAPVRLKTRAQSDDEIIGVVQAIAPAADDQGYGRVVRVDAVFPNPDGTLRSGMTGYAKIEGPQMRVWEAYLRSIRRFFQIEVWSWIP